MNTITSGAQPEDCGLVYAIVHSPSGRRYVGSTIKPLTERLRAHLWMLRNGRHTAAELQRDWSRDGESAFSVEILEEAIPSDRLLDAEHTWMARFEDEPGVYNVARRISKMRFGSTEVVIQYGPQGDPR